MWGTAPRAVATVLTPSPFLGSAGDASLPLGASLTFGETGSPTLTKNSCRRELTRLRGSSRAATDGLNPPSVPARRFGSTAEVSQHAGGGIAEFRTRRGFVDPERAGKIDGRVAATDD